MDADAGCNHFATGRMMVERRDGGHFDPYLGQFAATSIVAVSWFRQHLGQDQ
jgi:hypothetical protein